MAGCELPRNNGFVRDAYPTTEEIKQLLPKERTALSKNAKAIVEEVMGTSNSQVTVR